MIEKKKTNSGGKIIEIKPMKFLVTDESLLSELQSEQRLFKGLLYVLYVRNHYLVSVHIIVTI